ncbi:hypothetical protein ACFSJU_03135 [Paradesertivirga mongoliensis]|uniref:Uncharacterized protein n=1 Tax=Paradesertivirga mongoliensis TaxID=2100740 RepID=A0ABW4ZH57_9SPHI|nr:hypothetical protein [Pedobacter mongoliensis]
MEAKNILKIAMLPLVLCAIMAFTSFPPQGKGNNEDKGNKSQGQSQDKGHGKSDQGQKGNKSETDRSQSPRKGHSNADNPGNRNNSRAEADNRDSRGNSDNRGKVGNDNGNSRGKANGNDAGFNRGNGNSNADFKSRGNGNSRNMNGKRDVDINWNLNDFDNRWNPKNSKKVTICHNPTGDSNNGVTIRVSENALQAHRNHGDQIGECNINYSDRWSGDYIRSRENVYNTYEQTWERMSYGEALLRLAAAKILGLRTDLDRNRATWSASEIQRRETLIYDLENNSVALDNQLELSRQRLDSDVNIIISL